MTDEEISHPQQETGVGLSEQESCCYSYRAEHKSSDEHWEFRDKKVWWPPRSDKRQAPLSTEEERKPSSVVKIGGPPPMAPSTPLPEIKKPRESPDNDSFGASKHAEQPCSAGGAETSRSTMCETPAQAPLLTSKSKQPRKMAAGKSRNLLTWIIITFLCLTSIISVSGISSAQTADDKQLQHYTCADKERCHDLMTLYDHHDEILYDRAENETILECDGKTPASGTCTVCCDQGIYIICPGDTEPKEAEDNKGRLELTTVPPPPVKQLDRHHYVLIAIFGLAVIVIVIAAVVVYCCCYWRKQRCEISNSAEAESTPNHVSANVHMLSVTSR